jgi:DNA-binding transcriptional regulator YhcF (GntR family)
MYLISKRERSNNAVIKTTRELATETGISRNTILQTLKILEGHGIIWRKTGVIFISPNVIFRGSHQKRMKVILDYGKPAENIEAEQEQEKPEQPKPKSINLKDIPGLAVKKPKAEKRIRAAA